MSQPTTRRTVLAGAAGLSAAGVLVACGAEDPTVIGPDPLAAPARGSMLGKASDIPVSGGIIFADQNVVVTQPSPGEYRAFSATCTHKGCLVAAVSDNIISCKCHNAKYSATDGAVEGGPAPAPLAPMNIRVDGNDIRLLVS
jgi:Rieske Fe-S protein